MTSKRAVRELVVQEAKAKAGARGAAGALVSLFRYYTLTLTRADGQPQYTPVVVIFYSYVRQHILVSMSTIPTTTTTATTTTSSSKLVVLVLMRVLALALVLTLLGLMLGPGQCDLKRSQLRPAMILLLLLLLSTPL